jgi:hypothetical protein
MAQNLWGKLPTTRSVPSLTIVSYFSVHQYASMTHFFRIYTVRLWYRTVCSTLSMPYLSAELSSSFAAYLDEIRSPSLSTGVALCSICGVVSDVGAYGGIIVGIIWFGRLRWWRRVATVLVGVCTD